MGNEIVGTIFPLKSLQPWMDDFVNEAPPEGESYVQLKERTMQSFNEITNQPHLSVVIVCHGGVIRSHTRYHFKY